MLLAAFVLAGCTESWIARRALKHDCPGIETADDGYGNECHVTWASPDEAPLADWELLDGPPTNAAELLALVPASCLTFGNAERTFSAWFASPSTGELAYCVQPGHACFFQTVKFRANGPRYELASAPSLICAD